MPYRTIVDDIPSSLKRVVLGTFDWRGRARRTDGAVYYIVASAIGWFLASLLMSSSMELQRMSIALEATVLLSQFPLLAWAIRRAHDYEASGFIFIPVIALGLALWVGAELAEIDALGPSGSLLLRVVAIGTAIGFLCALFWKPNQGRNRFGPNPRLDASDPGLDPAR